MRVLHVLHTSLPHVCGYSIRSDRILTYQRERGIDVSVVTSAQQPDDAAGPGGAFAYVRTPRPRLLPSPIREAQLVRSLERQVQQIASREHPDIIHAHSPVLVGLPAYRVARRLGVPLVYEVRDLWENASVDRGKFAADSLPYRAARGLETWLLRRTDAVVTICEALRVELAPRCRPGTPLTIVPNGVDAGAFRPRDADADARRRWGQGDGLLIAYIGAFQPYEGLDLLVRAMPAIAARMDRTRLVIAGDGPERPGLEALAQSARIGDRVTFTGRVPHAEVASLYAVADVLVYPRILTRTTALTTPLKPLEAMAMGRCVLASDVPAMREIVRDGHTGRLFRAGDVDDLAAAVVRLLENPGERADLGARARTWVAAERDWTTVLERYGALYAGIGARSRAAA